MRLRLSFPSDSYLSLAALLARVVRSSRASATKTVAKSCEIKGPSIWADKAEWTPSACRDAHSDVSILKGKNRILSFELVDKT